MRRRASAWGAVLLLLVLLFPEFPLATQSGGGGATYSPDAYRCMAQAMYFEAGIEQREGMLAVGWVVLNRMAHPGFPSGVCQVIRQGGEARGCQFSYWCDGKSDTPYNGRVWRQAGRAARDLLSGLTADPTGGALFFHAVSLRRVPWRVEREQTTQIGRHIYYR